MSKLSEWALTASVEELQAADWQCVHEALRKAQACFEELGRGRQSWLDPYVDIAKSRIVPGIVKPIDMVLHCPDCGLQHIDAPEAAREIAIAGLIDGEHEHWTNPPHKTHLCHGCGHMWRPCATHHTNGVQSVSPGKNDSPLVPPLPADGLLVRVGSNREITASQHYKSGAIQVTTKLKIARRR